MAENDSPIEQRTISEIEKKFFAGKKKARNIDALRELLESEGWDLVSSILDLSVNSLGEKIMDTSVEHDKIEDDRDRETRDTFKWLRGLPRKLLGIFSDDEEDKEELPDPDPYD